MPNSDIKSSSITGRQRRLRTRVGRRQRGRGSRSAPDRGGAVHESFSEHVGNRREFDQQEVARRRFPAGATCLAELSVKFGEELRVNCGSTRTVRRVTGGCGDPRWRRCEHQPSAGLGRRASTGRRRGESRIRLGSSHRVRRGSALRVQRLTRSDRGPSPNCTRSAIGEVRHRLTVCRCAPACVVRRFRYRVVGEHTPQRCSWLTWEAGRR